MTTLCRSDWIEAAGARELREARIDPLKLPVTSFEKIAAAGHAASSTEARIAACLDNKNGNSPPSLKKRCD